MNKFSWYSAYKLVATISLGAVVEVIVIAVSEMNNIFLILLSGILSLFASLAVIQASVIIFGKLAKLIRHIEKRTRRAKIIIGCEVIKNEIVVFVHNDEILFTAKDVTCEILSLYAEHKFKSFAVWRNSKDTVTIKGRKNNFMYFATSNPDNTFSVRHRNGAEIFEKGWYEFTFHLKGKMSLLRDSKKVILDEYFNVKIEFSGNNNEVVATVKAT